MSGVAEMAGDAGVAVAEAAAAPVVVAAEPAAAPAAVAERPADAITEASAEAAAEPVAAAAEAEKPAEIAPEGEAPAEPVIEAAAEAKPDEAPAAALPVYETWTLPEGLKLEEAQSGALNNIFGKYGLTQDAGQELVDFAGSILKGRQEQMLTEQQETFLETRHKWAQQTQRDAGNRYNTMLTDAKAAMAAAVGPKDAEEFNQMLRITGAGDHPLFFKAWAALGKRLREPSAPGPTIPAPPSERAADRRYNRQRTQ